MNEPGSKKPNLYQLMCDVSSRFFELSGYPPRSMDEVADIEMSDSERLFCEKFSELWDSMEWMERSHPATYGKEEYYPETPALILSDPEHSGTDFILTEDCEAPVWIETPNALVAIFYDGSGSTETTVRIYENAESSFPANEYTLTGVSKR